MDVGGALAAFPTRSRLSFLSVAGGNGNTAAIAADVIKQERAAV